MVFYDKKQSAFSSGSVLENTRMTFNLELPSAPNKYFLGADAFIKMSVLVTNLFDFMKYQDLGTSISDVLIWAV